MSAPRRTARHPISSPPTTTRAFLAAVLSSLLPGAGQWLAGRRRRAAAFLSISAVLLVVAGYFLARGKVFLLKLSVQPRWLMTLLVAAVVLAAYRLYAVYDAFRAVRPARPRSRRATLAALTGLGFLLVVNVIPHVYVARYAWLEYDLITSVFAPDEPGVAQPTTTPTDPPETTPTTGDQPGTTGPTTTTSSTTTTTLPPPPLWGEGERLNVLLLGGDAGVGRTGVRTDTMIVVSIDPETGYGAIMSIPRNIIQVPLAPGPGADAFPDGFTDILNALYRYAWENPNLFPGSVNPGADALKGAIGEMLGIPMHYYALVNLDGFVEMIDALGGITMRVTERVYDAEYPNEDGSTSVIDIQPGVHEFDGHTALAYARSRHGSSDYNRMGRQRCVLEAMASQADVITLLRAFPSLVPVIKDNVATDIPVDRLPEIIELAEIFDRELVVSVRFIPPGFTASYDPNGYPIPAFDTIRSAVDIIMTLPPAEAIAVLQLDPLEEVCPSIEEPPPPTTTTTTTTLPTSSSTSSSP